ncbi:hypothetical protein Poly41_45730 [Novipirellula artificiosorum]|uniref:Squalene cyclase C-terminal domain-containing protein n=1 Tax=Novipirellula artificiosorum TaxID=2528016 RepID=A0A5C6DE04_9BACT|nr:hypothetical protein Poly41_45730 [Novipirellula artificiosorum]
MALLAVTLLIATIWLFRRGRRQGRQAGVICLITSIALHVALVILIPMIPKPNGGAASSSTEPDNAVGVDEISLSSFDPEMEMEDHSAESPEADIAPLPLSAIADLLEPTQGEAIASVESDPLTPAEASEPIVKSPLDVTNESSAGETVVPESLASAPPAAMEDLFNALDAEFAKLTDPVESRPEVPTEEPATQTPSVAAKPASVRTATVESTANPATVAGERESDFANRVGSAKTEALLQTGGTWETEAAVAAALKFLAANQRADGAWDPRSSDAGVERQPLGMARPAAGTQCETAITGLALLTMIGAGNTHQQGDYADNVYRGLAYLIGQQKANGSLAGGGTIYEANYCHGMAALAMCEAAAITQDPSAVESARRAMQFTRRMQHPSTGGWRYTENDPGDLSQLGWQAMVLDAGSRAGIPPGTASVQGIGRFLKSVRAGRVGGLATYRAGEATSRTMTAEALATRLLIGQPITASEIAEAEQSLLQQKPGVGQDNYYYWYYATLALHQLQDDAWEEWNEALQRRLLSTQLPDGRWPTQSVWGGYGGRVYTTSMAALCLESYYRHAIRGSNKLQRP